LVFHRDGHRDEHAVSDEETKVMIVTGKAIPRRTILRGLGAAVALPLLDGMVPAFAAVRHSAAGAKRRLGIVYVPHGAVMDQWTPAAEGAGFEFSPILRTVEAFRDQLIVISGLDNGPALALQGEPAGGHGRIGAAFLTGVHAKPTEGADFRAGISIDQIAANHLGQETQLASLELGLESTDLAGACDVGFSCAYVNTLSWRSPTTPLPMENNPRAVFERLFGDSSSTDTATRLARMKRDRSLLDSVTQKVADLKKTLGTGDEAKLDEYLEAVRDIERRIQKAEAQSARELPAIDAPSGSVPSSFEEYAKLMFDLQLLAYQSDITRVITFMVGKELSVRTYPELGVPDPHHPLSHHQNDSAKLEKLSRINVFHLKLFAYYLDKLRSTQDGDSSLLDQTAILYGSGMGDSNLHDPRQLPLLVAGGGAGAIQGGRHLRYPKETPLTNLYLALLQKVGVPVERIGDSTGAIQHLSSVQPPALAAIHRRQCIDFRKAMTAALVSAGRSCCTQCPASLMRVTPRKSRATGRINAVSDSSVPPRMTPSLSPATNNTGCAIVAPASWGVVSQLRWKLR
jgi:hypothetical protein